MCRVFVGDDTEPYMVHHDLIASSSEFFKRALHGDFKERDGDVKLPEQKSSTFDAYYRWLYTNTLEPFTLSTQPIPDFELYILGDAIQDERLRNSVIDNIIKDVSVSGMYPVSFSHVTLVFENTPKTSTLRKMLIDFLGIPFE